MSTKELRYPLKCEGRTYEVVEDRGQVICTGPAAAPPSAYWAATQRESTQSSIGGDTARQSDTRPSSRFS